MEKTINIEELFQLFKKRLLLVIIVMAIFTATTGIFSYFFLTKVYQSSTQILVNQTKSENEVYSPNEVQTNLQLIGTYSIIIKSPTILDKVIKKENLEMTSGELNKLISVSNAQGSQVVNITVQNKNPEKSKSIADAVASTFQNEIKSIMNVDNVSILTKAEVGSLTKPNLILNMTVALVVGLMVGVGIAFLLEYLDKTIKKEKDIEEQLGLPVLGAVNIINMERNTEKRGNKLHISETRGDSFGS